ncbi:MAG: type II CAAX endopeptidase family protein [Microbacterium sp.]|uniref:CPBP family intramembrane glutamic endopeptidase n=1 Tax=Microbacterium sp. TaxID=51671 RepID=UPI0039E23409
MSEQPTGVDVADPPPAESRPRRRSSRRTDWRLGGSTVARWRERTLAVALVAVGLSVIVGALIASLWSSSWASSLATVVGWVGMLVAVAWALSRSRPIGLFVFRWVDVLFGLGLGIVLRTAAGWIDVDLGGSGAFPSYATVNGALSSTWWLDDLLGPVVIAPSLEELFFRGVLLVSLYTVLRRPFGKISAGLVAFLATTGFFVLLHAVAFDSGSAAAVSLALLGGVCAALVLLTGRIWAAIVTHVVYNATFVILAVLGTLLG